MWSECRALCWIGYNAVLSVTELLLMSQPPDKNPAPSFGAVLASAVAAMFGVQSSKNRERDFTRGKPIHYIIVGLVLTLVFVLSVWGLVKMVLSNAGL